MKASHSCFLCLVGCSDIFGHHLRFHVCQTGSTICTRDTFQMVYHSSFRLQFCKTRSLTQHFCQFLLLIPCAWFHTTN